MAGKPAPNSAWAQRELCLLAGCEIRINEFIYIETNPTALSRRWKHPRPGQNLWIRWPQALLVDWERNKRQAEDFLAAGRPPTGKGRAPGVIEMPETTKSLMLAPR